MASSYSNLGIELMATGEKSNSWGTVTNTNWEIIDESINATVTIALSGATYSLADYSDGVANQDSRKFYIQFTGSAGNCAITVPSNNKLYGIRNGTNGTLTFTLGSGTTCTLGAGRSGILHVDLTGSACKIISQDYPNASTASSASVTAANIGLAAFDNTNFTITNGVVNLSSAVSTSSNNNQPNTLYDLAAANGSVSNSANIHLVGDSASGDVDELCFEGGQNITITRGVVTGTSIGKINIAGPAVNSYSTSTEEGSDGNNKIIRLSSSDGTTDDIKLAVGVVGSTHGLTIAESGDIITFAHADTSTQASSNNSGTTFIQDITLDEFGHITGIGTATTSSAWSGLTGSPPNVSTFTNNAGYLTSLPSHTHTFASLTSKPTTLAGYGISDGGGTAYSAGTGMSLSGTTFNCTIDSPTEVGLGNLSSSGNNLSGSFTATGNITAYSDISLKTNVKTIENALDKVNAIRGVTYTMHGKEGSGVIAQELEKVMPMLVNSDSSFKSVAYGNITGLLIQAVKELTAKIEKMEECDCYSCRENNCHKDNKD